MCVTPVILRNGSRVACRRCWQCQENRVNDWVGRCIAEKKTARHTSSVTLTYGRDIDEESSTFGQADHMRAAVLTYSDVQRWLKWLRKDGFPCRYFAVGEYGSLKQRAHWHLVVFWQDEPPAHPVARRFDEPHWKHGVSYYEPCESGRAIRYVCKYLQKDAGDALRFIDGPHMSKTPPLGAAYFAKRAGRFVENHLAPQDGFYTFPGEDDDRKGRPRRYLLTGKSLDMFCQSFVDQWVAAHPGKWWPHSQLIEDYLDRQVQVDWLTIDPQRRKAGQFPWMDPPGGGRIQFSEPHNAYFVVVNDRRLWWSYDIEGNRAWQSEIRTEKGRPDIRAELRAYRELSQPSILAHRS